MRRTGWAAAAMAIGLAACADAPTAPVADGELAAADQLAEARQGPTAPESNLIDVAMSVNARTGEFSTLIAAVVAADLVDALSARGQRTVFAPTDAAFAELGLNASNVGSAFDQSTLRSILLYHVAPGRRAARSVVRADRIRMLSGGFNMVEVENGTAYIGGAEILQTDVLATNGIIHGIDAVLIPGS